MEPPAFSVTEKRDKYFRLFHLATPVSGAQTLPLGLVRPRPCPLAKGRYIFVFNNIRIVLLPIPRQLLTLPRSGASALRCLMATALHRCIPLQEGYPPYYQ